MHVVSESNKPSILGSFGSRANVVGLQNMLETNSQPGSVEFKIFRANDQNLKDTIEGKAGYFRPAFFTVNFDFDVGSIKNVF